jgi:hypothetical protein
VKAANIGPKRPGKWLISGAVKMISSQYDQEKM